MSTDLVKKIDKYAPHIRALAFFTSVFAYILLVVEPRLIYQALAIFSRRKSFILDVNFISQFFKYPGGICQGLAQFLLQFYHTEIFGALIATLIAYLLYTSTRDIARLAGDKLSDIFFFIPSLIVLVTHAGYDIIPTIDLWLPITLCFFIAFQKHAPSNTLLRCIIFALLFATQYYIAGGTALIFAILAAIFALIARRNILESIFYVLIAIALPYIVTFFFFGMTVKDAYLNTTMFDNDQTTLSSRAVYSALYIYIAAIPIIAVAWKNLKKRKHRNAPQKKLNACIFKHTVVTILLFAALAATAYTSMDHTDHALFTIMDMAEQRKWNELLKHADTLDDKQYNISAIHNINRALYHTGQLSEKMFAYRQSPVSLLLNAKRLRRIVTEFEAGQVFMELGNLNLAEKKAFEIMIDMYDHPVILKRLALISIAKGQTETARFYLNALRKNLVYRSQAENLLHNLEKDPLLSENQQIKHLRTVMLTKDNYDTDMVAETTLLRLLDNNKNNKMAFEYLMAHYMLNAGLQKVAKNIHRLNDFDYQYIPRHYEEAILLYAMKTGRKPNLHGRRIRKETLDSTNKFMAIYRKYENKQAAADAMFYEFHESFPYYYFFYGIDRSK